MAGLLFALGSARLAALPTEQKSAPRPARPVASRAPELSPLEEVAAEYAKSRADDDEQTEHPLLALGERELAQGHPVAAAATLKDALKAYAGDTDTRGRVLMALGRAHAANQEHTLAKSCFEMVLRDGPRSLASEAQLQKALLESSYLLTPRRFRAVVARLALENPMTLDFDMLKFMVGSQRGYRLDRVDVALREFETVWTKYPKGARAPDAMLHHALIEGLVLSRNNSAWERLKLMIATYPDAPVVPIAEVARATMAIAQGNIDRALEVLAHVADDSDAAREALFLSGLLVSYYQDDPQKGIGYFGRLQQVAGNSAYKNVAIYHRALLKFAIARDTAGAKALLAEIPAPPQNGDPDDPAVRIGVLRQQLDASIDKVADAKQPDQRDFAFAEFWYAHHHFSRALRELANFLRAHPSSPLAGRARFLAGKIEQEDVENPEEARKLLRGASGDTPAALAGEIEWRSALSRQGDEASRPAFEAIYKNPDNPFKPLAGVELARQGALDERGKRELLHEVIAREPSGDVRAKLLTQLARAYRDAGNPRRALEVYQEALPFDSALGPEIAKTRSHLEIQDIESRLARGKLLEQRVVDPAAQLKLGRLQLLLGDEDAAKKSFQAVLKALPLKRTPATIGKDGKKKKPQPLSSPIADQARLELTRLNVKASKFPTQALRYVEDYLSSISPNSPHRAEGVAVKAEILEKEFDPDKQLLPTYRYLVDAGYQPDVYALKLAKAYAADKKPDQALAILGPIKWTAENGPEALLLTSELQGRVGLTERSIDTLQVLATRWPETAGGKEAGARLAKALATDMERALGRYSTDPEAFHRALAAFLARMRPEFAGAARATVEKISSETYVEALTLPELTKLADLLSAAKDSDPRLVARLHAQAATLAPEPAATQHRLDQALALAAAGESDRAVTLLTELAPRAPGALLQMAILQEREFKDRTSALARLDEVLARKDTPPDVRTKAVLRRAALEPATAVTVLAREVALVPGGPQASLIEEQLAKLTKGRAAADHYLKAGAMAPDREEKIRLTIEGAKVLIDAQAYTEASRALKGIDETDSEGESDPRIQQFYMRSEALSQLDRLQKGMNLDDPESPTNLSLMLAQARLLISPLREYDRAQALLNEIEPFFPKAATEDVARLRREMAHRWSLRALEDKEEKLPRDLMQLAVTMEEDLGDYRTAARYLKEMLAKHPKDPLALIARMRLIRLFAVRLGKKSDAAKLALGLGQVEDARDFKPEVAAAFNLVVSQQQYETDLRQMDFVIAADPRGNMDLVRLLTRMGRVCVEEFRDQQLASEVLKRMLTYKDGTAGPEMKAAAYELCMLAAVELSPLKAAVYGLSERARFLATAAELAQPGPQLARVRLEQGYDHLHEQDLERAAEAFDAASRAAPASPYGREALLNLAQVQEKRKNLDGARDAYARLAEASQDKKPLLKLASKQLPRLEKLSRSHDREIVLAQAPQLKTPFEYYNTAKEQMHTDDDLEGALVNFRTYLRLGKEQKNIVDAYLEVAEILVRLEKPREALDALKKVEARFPTDRRAAEIQFKLGELHEIQLADLKTAEGIYHGIKKKYAGTKWAKESDKALKRLADTRKERAAAGAVAAGKSTVGADIAAIRKKYVKEKGNFTEALDALKSQLEATTAPNERAQLFLEIGTIYDTELKDYPPAVENYEKYLEEASDQTQKGNIHLRIAELKANELREPEEALELYQQFGRKYFNHPKRIDALLAMAQLQEKKLNDVQAAINIYRNVADSYPRSGYDEQALIRIAELSRSHFADYTGAVDALRRLVRDFPFSAYSPYAQMQIANILEVELGDKGAAQIEYQRLIDAYPQSPYADSARQALVRLRGRQ